MQQAPGVLRLVSPEISEGLFYHSVDFVKLDPSVSTAIEDKIAAFVIYVLKGEGSVTFMNSAGGALEQNLKARQIVYFPKDQVYSLTSGSIGLEYLLIRTEKAARATEAKFFAKDIVSARDPQDFYEANVIHPEIDRQKPAIPYCMNLSALQPGHSTLPCKWPMSAFHYVLEGEGTWCDDKGQEVQKISSGERILTRSFQGWRMKNSAAGQLRFITITNTAWLITGD